MRAGTADHGTRGGAARIAAVTPVTATGVGALVAGTTSRVGLGRAASGRLGEEAVGLQVVVCQDVPDFLVCSGRRGPEPRLPVQDHA